MPKYRISESDLIPGKELLKEEIESLREKSEEWNEKGNLPERIKVDELLSELTDELYSIDNDEKVYLETAYYWEDREDCKKALEYYLLLKNLNPEEKKYITEATRVLLQMAWDNYFFDKSIKALEQAVRVKSMLNEFQSRYEVSNDLNGILEKTEDLINRIRKDFGELSLSK